jgi:uncharacterized surface protein with fasciclin (FAS1) repeats
MLSYFNSKIKLMKNSKLLLMLFLALSFTFVACDDDDDDTPTSTNNGGNTNTGQSIAEIAIADSRTDSLVVALSRAGLVPTFQGPGSFTVFAPTNQAFVDLLDTDPSWNSIADIPVDALTDVLTYHVLATEVKAGDLTEDTYGTTLNDQGSTNNENTVLEIDLTPNPRINNAANITDTDIDANNGVIHIIDAVITPRTTVQLALNDERFTTLVSALTTFGDTLINTLNGFTASTIFAPTNDAFQDLLDSNPAWNSLSDIPRATLRNVLLYHVNGAANVQSKDLTDNQTIATALTGSSLTVDLSSGAKLETTSNQSVNIIVTDVQGTNGVIHAVNAVLLP